MAQQNNNAFNEQECISIAGSSNSRATNFSPEELQALKENMSSEANKDIREKYRNLLIYQQEKADGAGEGGLPVEELRMMVMEANEAFYKVKRPREAALDAEFLKTCGALVKSNIENKQYNTAEFYPTAYSQDMIKFMQGEDNQEWDLLEGAIWKRLGKAVSSIYRSTAPVESAFAGLDYEKPKKAAAIKKKTKDQVAARKVPEAVKESQTGEERQTEEVRRILDVLKRRYNERHQKPIFYYEFVINPQSYCYTIENMFHTSFLIHELKAQITEDENGLPVIMPLGAGTSKGAKPKVPSSQCVISLSTLEFKNIVSTYGLKESMIPPPQNTKKRS